jgi:predicted dehydrogenase/threonine dehydrogenase-like Zn-dependent dehydrogenase
MKQILQSYKTGELELAEIPIPIVQPGTVLVQTQASLISAGTERMIMDLASKSLMGKARERPDLVRKVLDKARNEGVMSTVQTVFNKLDTPIPLGYSAAGVVVEVGHGVSEFQVGDRVAVAGAGYANHAEYNIVPKNLVARLPDEVTFAEGAFGTVGAIALQGVRQAAPTLGERFAVIGLGLLGQITVSLLAANGCRVLGVDVDPDKIPLALKMGAEAATVGDWTTIADDLSDGYGLDGVIITASTKSNELLNAAANACRKKGRVVGVGVFGMEMDRSPFYLKEIDFRMSCSYGPGRYDSQYEEQGHDYPIAYVRWTEQRNIQTVLELIGSKRLPVNNLVTHHYEIANALTAYSLIRGELNEPYLGVILDYPKAGDEATAPERAKVELGGKSRKSHNRLGVGVCGAGGFASAVFIPALAKSSIGDLVGIVSAAGMHARHLGKKFGFRYVSTELDHLLKDDSVNAVCLLTRHHLHADQIVRCLEAGKSVFVEKPMALTVEETQRIIEARNASEGDVMVGFNRRFSSLAVEAKDYLSNSDAPALMTIRINAGRIPDDHWVQDPKEGGGRILGEVCHWISLMQYFTDSVPVEVSTMGIQPQSGWRGDDNISILLRFADGSLGTLVYFASGNSQASKEWVEVARGGQMIQIDNWVSLQGFGRRRLQSKKFSQDKGFSVEIPEFLKAVKDGREMPIPFEDSVATTLATLAVKASLERGQRIQVDSLLESK